MYSRVIKNYTYNLNCSDFNMCPLRLLENTKIVLTSDD